jgi:hypothetical protein
MRVSRKRHGRPLAWPALVTALAIVLLVPGRAAAATLTVCPNGCQYATIDDALAAAHDGDRIKIAAGTYEGGFTIRRNVSLLGAGAGLTTIDGGGTVATVDPGVSATIRGVTIKGGSGGGVVNFGTLSLAKSVVSGNAAQYGAGLYNSGTMSVSDTTVRDNSATSHAGGVLNTETGQMTIQASTVSGNTAPEATGIANGGTLTVAASTVSGNTATAGTGGGIRNGGGQSASLTITGSTISGNSATDGGGIFNFANGVITIGTSTISDNTASGGGCACGGAIRNAGRLAITGSTLSRNAADYGGAIYNNGDPGALTIEASTISDNTGLDGGGIQNDVGTVTVVNSTVRGNEARGVNGLGGGFNNAQSLTIRGSSISGNRAVHGGA